MQKLLKPLIIIALLGAAGFALYQHFFPQGSQQPNFATEPVRRGNIENTVLATGMLQASKLVNVGAQVSGQITNLAVDLGQEVKKGDLIAQIDDLSQRNTLKESEASLASINAQIAAKQAEIKQASLEYTRQVRMYKDKATSKAELDIAEADLAVDKAALKQLQAQKEQAEITLDTAKIDLGYTTIRAPIDGTVVYTAVEAGQTVNANQTTPTIVELAQLDTMTVEAQISEADVVNVKPDQSVFFSILGKPDHQFNATLRAIEPGPTIMTGDDSNLTVSDSDAIYFNGLFDIANPDNILRIGMTAQVSIVLEKSENALLIPAQIIRKRGPKTMVPVLEDGKRVMKEIKTGINNKLQVEVLSGLEEGDLVIVGASDAGNTTNNRRRGPRPF